LDATRGKILTAYLVESLQHQTGKRSFQVPWKVQRLELLNISTWYLFRSCAAYSTSSSTCRSPLLWPWSASWCSPSPRQTGCQTLDCRVFFTRSC
jgi:hypothetical protein